MTRLSRVGLVLFVACAALPASAQSLAEYLKIRKSHSISAASGVGVLETLVGERVVEVEGEVTGTAGGPRGRMVILQGTGQDSLFVTATELPAWMQLGVRARLIIRAQRPYEGSRLDAEMLAAVTADDMRAWEAKQPRPKVRAPMPVTSRGAQAPVAPRNWNVTLEQALPYYASFVRSRNPRLSEREAVGIAQHILSFSQYYGVDARLIMAIVLVESGFDPNAVSRSGARGLGQLMPGTARELGVRDSFDTEQNLFGTTKLISQHLDRYHRKTGDPFEALILSLAAYNAGPGAVRRHGGVPPYRETQRYVQKVISTYRSLLGG